MESVLSFTAMLANLLTIITGILLQGLIQCCVSILMDKGVRKDASTILAIIRLEVILN